MHRISLQNVAFEGDNNVYLIDDDSTVLIDTGDPMPETREQLTAGLAEHDVTFEAIDEIFITHWHGDHSGLAGEIQADGGATVRIHHADAPLVAHEAGAWDAMHDRQADLFEEWGMPPEKQATLRSFFDSGPDDIPADVTPFEDGAVFDLGETTLEVVHAPGHAAGMSCFVFDGTDGREVYAGDALLPIYTPNVGGADVRVEEPLRQYLETLDAFVGADYDRAWPGHRDPIDDPTARATEIIHHHEERAWRVLKVLDRSGPADAWTVSAELFGTLESIHILHGPGEAYAHLDHLRRNGAVRLTADGYRLTDATRDRLDTLDGDVWPLTAGDGGRTMNPS